MRRSLPSMAFSIQLQQIEQMAILLKLKSLVKKADMFYSTELLRFDGEGEFSTLTGGILSLAIVATILAGFASMILDTLNRTTISTQLTLTKQPTPTPSLLTTTPQSDLMFGVQIWRFNLSSPTRYFDLFVGKVLEEGGQVTSIQIIPMEQCTRQHWQKYPNILQTFQKLQISGWLCPPLDFSFHLFGKYTSEFSSRVGSQLNPCQNSTDPLRPCAPQSEIDALFASSSYFYFTFYFLNPLINPAEKEYKSYYLEEKSYVIFGEETGSEAYVSFADYTVNTDESIWPYTDVRKDQGVVVQEETTIRTFPRKTNNTSYVIFWLVKSANSLVYTREVQKISSVFSFIGGTISAISALLFIVKIYNNLSLQLSIALQIFRPDESSSVQPSTLHMNLFYFIKYYWSLFMRFLGRPLSTPALIYLHDCQKEILQQLDIRSLVKRVVFLEHCMHFVFEDYQLEGLQMKRPTTPGQVRRIRENCESLEKEEEKGDDSSQIHLRTEEKESPVQIGKADEVACKFKEIVPVKHGELRITDMVSQSSYCNHSKVSVNLSRSKLNPARQSHLKNLQKDAFSGNPTSQKIWQYLEMPNSPNLVSRPSLGLPPSRPHH